VITPWETNHLHQGTVVECQFIEKLTISRNSCLIDSPFGVSSYSTCFDPEVDVSTLDIKPEP
jgi:hypothetical protein